MRSTNSCESWFAMYAIIVGRISGIALHTPLGGAIDCALAGVERQQSTIESEIAPAIVCLLMRVIASIGRRMTPYGHARKRVSESLQAEAAVAFRPDHLRK